MLYPGSMVDPEMMKCGAVQCGVCHKDIPAPKPKNMEAVEYIMYFCSLECYEIWNRQDADQPGQETPS